MPQIYLTAAAGKPVKRLIGFTKADLSPNTEQRVFITIDPRLLADFDVNKQRWRIIPGRYHIEIGPSSAEKPP